MRIKNRRIIQTAHQQDGLTQQLMNDTRFKMDDNAIMGGATSLDITAPVTIRNRIKSRVR